MQNILKKFFEENLDEASIGKYYFIINQAFPCLSRIELESLLKKHGGGTIKNELTGVFLASASNDEVIIKIQSISSTLKETGRILMIMPLETEMESDCLFAHDPCIDGKPYIKPKRIQGFGKTCLEENVIDKIYSLLKKKCNGKLKKSPKKLVRALYTDGLIIVGEVLSMVKKGGLIKRNPHNLPYYTPGALNPWYTSLLVNIASSKNEFINDPFCGTGGFPLASAELLRKESICSDIRGNVCLGSLKNVFQLKKDNYINIVRADARFLPIRKGIEATIVTDPPYGRSVRGVGAHEVELINEFLVEADNILHHGSVIILSIPQGMARKLRYKDHYSKNRGCLMYIHNKLTRIILVLMKNE